jgi:hypothetical protein
MPALVKDTYKMWHREQAMTDVECRNLIRLVEAEKAWCAYQVDPDSNGMRVHQWIYDLDTDLDGPWSYVYDRAQQWCYRVNGKVWKFDLTKLNQPLRVAKYTPGLSHDWHVDYTKEDRSKLAFTLALNEEYEGGNLQVLEGGPIPKPRIGEATWFPAYQGHRVSPVTVGTRYVLLGWYTGPRFR